MDVTVVDVTDIPETMVGDEVVLIGRQGNEQIRAEEISRQIGTTEHEITTRLLRRLTRVYV
jgi:alanine racemase